MWWKRAGFCGAVCAALLLAVSPGAAQDPYNLSPAEKCELFLEHLVRFAGVSKERTVEFALRYELATALSEAPDHPGDLVGDFIRAALLQIEGRFREAARAIEGERDAEAAPILEGLAAVRDPYVKAYAQFELAKIRWRAKRYVEAARLLDGLLREERMYLIPDYDARMLSARCFEALDRDLLAYLEYLLFLVQFPRAPQDLLKEARTKAVALEAKIGRPLTHIASRMDGVETWLGEGKTSEDPTQKEERELVSALDKFIELAEERERST